MTLAAFSAAWMLHLIAAASPGPAILMAARTGVTQGFRVGAWLALGIAAGALFWAVAALFGLEVLFKAAPALFWAFKIAGGLFLCWIAVQMWRHAHLPLHMTADAAVPPTPLSAFRSGVLTQLSNPKPAIFFGAVFAGTVPPGTSLPWIAALLLMVLVNEIACILLVARAFSFNRPRDLYQRFKAAIDRSFGGILGLLGMKVALT